MSNTVDALGETPTVALCVTCKGRAQHLKVTLPRNLADNADDPRVKFIILDYGSPDDLVPWLRFHHQAEIDAGRIVLYRYAYDGAFRMAHAKNMAHRLALREGADILVNLDADNFTGPGFSTYVADTFVKHGPHGFLAIGKMIPGVTPRGVSGRIATTAYTFLKMGGYDERFETWSPDDKDYNQRLRRAGHAVQVIDDRFMLCVRHNDKMRFRDYPHVRSLAGSGEAELAQSTSTVVNFGRFGCGTVTRNLGDEPIELGLVPTRIFGIGMHKTGTTSLHAALKVLGVDSAHWENAHWAKAIWTEMTTAGRSLTLERHYALCDLPITILYEQLDRAYPGSKFILTTRDEARWLASVERHFSRTNPFRAQWDRDPVTHRLHRALYGRKTFDATVFLERFRRHNAEVRSYFKDRPDDLLILDVDDGWAPLCRFLGQTPPKLPYPKLNGAV
jgi:hypothetical protein